MQQDADLQTRRVTVQKSLYSLSRCDGQSLRKVAEGGKVDFGSEFQIRVQISLSWWRSQATQVGRAWSHKRQTSGSLVTHMPCAHTDDVPGKTSESHRSGLEYRLKSHLLLQRRKVLVEKGPFQESQAKVKMVVQLTSFSINETWAHSSMEKEVYKWMLSSHLHTGGLGLQAALLVCQLLFVFSRTFLFGWLVVFIH